MFSFIVFPYRDFYFANKFGWSVRDLSIIKALQSSKRVSSLCVVQRPISIYERLLGKHKSLLKEAYLSYNIQDFTSYNLLGPFTGRKWTRNLYYNYLSDIKLNCNICNKSNTNTINVILDFTPIANIAYDYFTNYIIWYDLIDNFSKHNRFSIDDRNMVISKYNYINEVADLITAVTPQALEQFDSLKSMTISNGLSCSPLPQYTYSPSKYDMGFIGFITDKFDISLIKHLAIAGNFKIVIYGEVYDKSVGRKLSKIPNVELGGKFHDKDLPKLMSTFKIGLIPYISEKSHDGSPIKLYQYLLHGKQVISTTHYIGESDQFGKYVYIANDHPPANLIPDTRAMLNEACTKDHSLPTSISNMIRDDLFWDYKINMVLNRLELIAQR